MRRLALCCGVLLMTLPAPAPARAQQRSEPRLFVTMFGGVSTGFSLWQVAKQPLTVLELNDPTQIDTLQLSRDVQSGISLGASATYFPSPHLGFTGEIFYMGLGLDDGCRFVYAASLAGYANDQACSNIVARGGGAATIAFTVGAMYRVAPRGFAAPYVRLQAGVATRYTPTAEMVGDFTDENGITRTRLIIADPSHSKVHPTAVGGVGVLVPVGPGYQVGLELRDNLLFIEKVAGPADALAVAPTETVLKHSASLLVRFDIVLEHKRGRRY
jgi:hypothetical protein